MINRKVMIKPTEQKVLDYIHENALFPPAQGILLAISGGADSLCLFRILLSLSKQNLLETPIFLAHVNHNLRGAESDQDQLFVEELARKNKIPLKTISVDVEAYSKEFKVSIETAARDLRRKHIAIIAREFGVSCIITAHHCDDNAETLIHRMMRGCGYRGLSGIWAKKYFSDENITYIRPMLSLNRAAIIQYLRSINQQWREDSTNAQTIYTRNKIRHKLLPQLQLESSRDISEQLFSLSESARKLQNRLLPKLLLARERIDFDSDKAIVSCAEFEQITIAVKIALIGDILDELGFSAKRLDSVHMQNILRIAGNGGGTAKIDLPLGFEVVREYGWLIFRKPTKTPFAQAVILPDSGEVIFAGSIFQIREFDFDAEAFELFKANKSKNVEWFDCAKLAGKITLRSRKEADRFTPIGQSVGKRIGKFLTSAKISRLEREKVVVIADEEKVIWLSPIRACDETKITPATKRILEIKIKLS